MSFFNKVYSWLKGYGSGFSNSMSSWKGWLIPGYSIVQGYKGGSQGVKENGDKSLLSQMLNSGDDMLGISEALGTESLGGLFSALANRITAEHLTGAENEQNAFNAEEAQKQRDYETEMSNTAYQRQTADMRAAGINPALMYGGTGASGASTPSGSSASGNGNGSPLDFMSLIGQIMQYSLGKGQLEMQQGVASSEISLNKAKEAEIEAGIGKTKAETRLMNAQAVIAEFNARPDILELDRELKSGSLAETRARTAKYLEDVKVQSAMVVKLNAEAKLTLTDEQYKQALLGFQKIQNEVAEKCKEYKINQESYKADSMYWDSIISCVKGTQFQMFGLDVGGLSSNPITMGVQLAGMAGYFTAEQLGNGISGLADVLKDKFDLKDRKDQVVEKIEEEFDKVFGQKEKTESDKVIDDNYWNSFSNQAFK